MSMNDNIPDTQEEKRELLRQLLLEELNTLTYETSEREFDPERVAALNVLIDGLETDQGKVLPEGQFSEEFLKRFNFIHSRDSIGDEQQEETPVIKIKTKKKLRKPVDRRLLKIGVLVGVVICTFGAVNVVTYASARQSVFQLIGETVSTLRFKINPAERQLEDGEYLADVRYVEHLEGNLTQISGYFSNEIYIPQWMPDFLTESSVQYSQTDGITAHILFFSKDYEQHICLNMYENSTATGEMLVEYDGASEKSRHVVTIGGTRESLYIADSDEMSMAYFILNDVLYLFRYSVDTETFIKIVENMEVYK